MADANTAKYLKDNIGDVLSRALSEMAVQQPNDGVDFLAQWLKTYAEQEEMKIFREKEEKQMEEDRVLTQKQQTEKAARQNQKAAETKSVEDGYQGLLAKLNDTEKSFEESYWSELVAVTKQYMGAQSVYLGVLDEEGLEDVEAPLIRYTHENVFASSPSLLDKILPKMKDAETSNLTYNALTESIPEEELASKCIWKPPPPPQEPVPEGEDPPPAPEGPKYLPVSVPCVTDVPIMHYFEMPRLGAYAAFPLVYPTYYTQEAHAEAKKFEEEKAEDARQKKLKEEERAAAIAEAQEKGLEEPTFEEEEAQPEKVMTLTGTTTKLVLCMDTLGTNTLLDESKYADLMALCDACAACKARTEIKEIDDQALFAIGVDRRAAAEDVDTGLPCLREDAKTALKEREDADMAEINGKGLDAEVKKAVDDVCFVKHAHLQAQMVVGKYKEQLKAYVNACFTVQPEVLNIFAAVAFLIGYTKAEVYPTRKTVLKWPTMKALVSSDAFFAKLEVANLEAPRKELADEQKLINIHPLLPADFNEEKAKEIDPAFEVLWLFLKTAIDFRAGALKQTQVEYEGRKKAAEEAETAFEEPDPATLDDDHDWTGLSDWNTNRRGW